ncbi:MAG: fibrobacter succinogenes major paralogous domain-containing protein [Bacteroidales bacterium]|jgi:uncharacterized protein (TIGR02145 family)
MKTFIRNIALIFAIMISTGIIYSCISLNDGGGGWGIEVTTRSVTDITYHSAVSELSFTGEGGSWGLCLDTALNPTISDRVIECAPGHGWTGPNYQWDDLIPSTIYHVRAFTCPVAFGPNPSSSTQVRYGSDVEFKTLPLDTIIVFNPNLTYGVVSDIDGNNYKTIQIGTQVWMAENLRVTKYRNGSSIQNIEDQNTWINNISGAYCFFMNNKLYGATFGCFYNFYAVANKSNLCPTGWHVPSNDEWTTLGTYLGGIFDAGGKLKETGETHWYSPNTGATNETGFTALPGGYYMSYESGEAFCEIGTRETWWSATTADTSDALVYITDYVGEFGAFGYPMIDGISVRCLKDN